MTDNNPQKTITYQDNSAARVLARAVLAFEEQPVVWMKPSQRMLYLVTRCDAYGNVQPHMLFEAKEAAEYYSQQVFGRDWQLRIRVVPFYPGGQTSATAPDTAEQEAMPGSKKKRVAKKKKAAGRKKAAKDKKG